MNPAGQSAILQRAIQLRQERGVIRDEAVDRRELLDPERVRNNFV